MGEIEKGYTDSHVAPSRALTPHFGKAPGEQDLPDRGRGRVVFKSGMVATCVKNDEVKVSSGARAASGKNALARNLASREGIEKSSPDRKSVV